MNFMARRVFLSRFKSFRATQDFIRLSSTKEPCSQKPNDIKDTKETKAESNCSQFQSPDSTCSPPCPPPPSCPPRLSNVEIDECSPCNYVPPTNRDPDYPDMTRMKKFQCKFQKDMDEIPVYLQGGPLSVLVYHVSVIITVLMGLFSLYFLYQMGKK